MSKNTALFLQGTIAFPIKPVFNEFSWVTHWKKTLHSESGNLYLNASFATCSVTWASSLTSKSHFPHLQKWSYLPCCLTGMLNNKFVSCYIPYKFKWSLSVLPSSLSQVKVWMNNKTGKRQTMRKNNGRSYLSIKQNTTKQTLKNKIANDW